MPLLVRLLPPNALGLSAQALRMLSAIALSDSNRGQAVAEAPAQCSRSCLMLWLLVGSIAHRWYE